MKNPADPSRLKVERILKERARALARIPETVRSVQGGVDVLAFTLGKERFALASVFVREVHPMGSITPVPCTPAFVLGIVNLGGRFYSILDFGKLLGIPPAESADPDGSVIFIGNAEMEFGIAAGSVLGIRFVTPEELQPPPPAESGLQGGFLRGICKDGLILLDGDRILMDKSILVHDETA
jgi:purine-binding chemotaxis protein CheW